MANWRDSYLVDFLRSQDNGAQLTMGEKWLYWECLNSITNAGEWVVLHRPPYAKRNRTLYRGGEISEALEALKSEV